MTDSPSTTRGPFDSAEGDPAFDQAVADCIHRLESGLEVDELWLAKRYPAWQQELKVFIADWDAFEGYSNEIRNLPTTELLAESLPDPFDGYEILQRIGVGGMGIIYKAKQTNLSRLVAIKMLHNVRHDRQRFQVEAEAVALLDHPNIVSIYEVGEHEGRPYFTMPFVDGRDLNSITEHEKLIAPRRAAQIASKIATAVHYAHSRGILHRDLKPGNILLDGEDEPHVTDFGLAKNLDSSDQLTRTNAIVGTPAYMAPEQALGRNSEVSVATDVYGVGTILYAMLTGEAPHTGSSSMEVLRRVIEAPPRGLHSSKVTQDLKVICEKCLEKVPADRYQSADALAADLKRYLDGSPILARPVSKLSTAIRWSRRNPALATLGVAAGVATLFALATMTLLLRSESDARAKAEEGQLRERSLNEQVQQRLNGENAARKKAELNLNEAYANYAELEQKANRPNEAFLWLCAAGVNSPIEKSDTNRRRIEAWMQRLPRPIFAYRAEGLEFATFDSSGRWLLCAQEDKQKFLVFDLALGKAVPIKVDEADGGLRMATWSQRPGVLWFATQDGRVVRANCESGKTHIVADVGSPILALAVSKDESQIAVGLEESLVLIAVDSVATQSSTLSLPAAALELQFACEDQYLLVTCEDRHVYRKDLNELRIGANAQVSNGLPFALRKRTSLSRTENRSLFYPLVFEDSKLAVFEEIGDEGIKLITFDIESGKSLAGCILGISYSNSKPRNGMIVTGGESAARVRLLSGPRHSERIVHENRVTRCAFSPDGKLIATADRQIIQITECTQLRDMRGDEVDDIKPPLSVIPHSSHVSDLEFSLDGRLLATVQFDGLIRVWDVTSAKQPRQDVEVEDHGNRAIDCFGGRVYLSGKDSTQFPVRKLSSIDLSAGTSQELVGDMGGQLRDVAISSDGGAIAMAIANRRAATGHVWIVPNDVHSGAEDSSNGSNRIEADLPAYPRAIASHPSKHLYAVLCSNSEALLIDGNTGQILASFTARPGILTKAFELKHNGLIEFSPDGRSIVLVGNKMSAPVFVLDARDCKPRFSNLRNPNGIVRHIDFSPDSHVVAIAGGRSGKVWFFNLENGEQAAKPLEHPSVVHSARFSPDGKFVVSGCRDGQARVFDWRTGKLQTRAFEQNRDVKDACFSSDGNSVVTISSDKLAKVWDVRTGLHACPPIFIGDGMRYLSHDRDLDIAIVSGDIPNVVFIPLGEPRLNSTMPAEDMMLLGELLSFAKIVDAGTVRLTTEGWMQRWEKFRRSDSYQSYVSDSLSNTR